MSLSQNQSILQILTTVKPVLQRLILIHADVCFIKFVVDCIFNAVKGNVCLSNKTNNKHTFKRFRYIISMMCQKKVKLSEKRRLLATNHGISLIKLIAPDVELHLSKIR